MSANSGQLTRIWKLMCLSHEYLIVIIGIEEQFCDLNHVHEIDNVRRET